MSFINRVRFWSSRERIVYSIGWGLGVATTQNLLRYFFATNNDFNPAWFLIECIFWSVVVLMSVIGRLPKPKVMQQIQDDFDHSKDNSLLEGAVTWQNSFSADPGILRLTSAQLLFEATESQKSVVLDLAKITSYKAVSSIWTGVPIIKVKTQYNSYSFMILDDSAWLKNLDAQLALQ